MAAGDLVKVRKIYKDENNVTNNGVDEDVTLANFMLLLPSGGAAGSATVVTRQTAPAAAPAAFADLTAAATAYNAMRTALIASGVLV